MDVSSKFSQIAALICEPARSKMLWSLLDGSAYTATELATFADISTTSASNHLSKLLDADLLKVEVQGRHRYYTFSNADVAYALEAFAHLAQKSFTVKTKETSIVGVRYCRTCYDHLAGFVGVQLVEAMEKKEYLKKMENSMLLLKKDGNGWRNSA